jgi:hypothetical protein
MFIGVNGMWRGAGIVERNGLSPRSGDGGDGSIKRLVTVVVSTYDGRSERELHPVKNLNRCCANEDGRRGSLNSTYQAGESFPNPESLSSQLKPCRKTCCSS